MVSSCIENKKRESIVLTNTVVNEWEIATVDTVLNIIERNRINRNDSIELKQILFYRDRLINHFSRRNFVKTLTTDTVLKSLYLSEFIIIERQTESNMFYSIIITKKNKLICFSYKFNPLKKTFELVQNDTINSKKLKSFVRNVKRQNSIKCEFVNGEYNDGNVIISFFLKDKIEIYPFLTYNFTNDIYRSYNDMFGKKDR